MSRAKIIFDSALEMEPGEKMVITCNSLKQMESLRSSLYRQRQEWQRASIDGSDIGVTRNTQGGKFILVVEKLDPVPPPVIIDFKGKIRRVVDVNKLLEPALVEPEDERIAVEFAQDIERKKQLMREDGMSEDEITAYFEEEAS
jgi:hypothetical protein